MNKTVAVGSKNRQKIRGSGLGTLRVFPETDPEILWKEIATGVSKQPMSLDEILRGARNRSTGVIRLFPQADYGIGIESGLYEIFGKWMDTSIVSIVDSEGKEALGQTISYEVGERIMELVFQGKELSDAVAETTARNTIETRDNYAALSNGAVTAVETFRDAVAGALSRLAFAEYHEF
jgi:non-canonical (house-cleaning) NTP pyrophosphatase